MAPVSARATSRPRPARLTGSTPTSASPVCASLTLTPAILSWQAPGGRFDVTPKGGPVAVTAPDLTPRGYFRRWIEGSDFSLESNTPAVPSEDLFYVMEA